MRTLILTILLLTVLTLTTNAYWFNDPVNGMAAVTTQPGNQYVPQMVRLTCGHYIIIFADDPSNVFRYQIINEAGVPQLEPEGRSFFVGNWGTSGAFLIADGEGGAITVFSDNRMGVNTFRIYGQRFDSLGNRLWGNTGLPMAIWTGTDNMALKDVAMDSIGNIFIAWGRGSGYTNWLYIQKINLQGQRLWGDYGAMDCGGISSCDYQQIVPDNRGGVLDAWEDDRASAGSYHIYAQHLDADGNPLWAVNGIELHDPISGLAFGVGYGGLEDGAPDGAGGGIWTYDAVYIWYVFRLTGTGQVLWRYIHGQQVDVEIGAPLVHPRDDMIWVASLEKNQQQVYQSHVYRFNLAGRALFGVSGVILNDGNAGVPNMMPTTSGIIAESENLSSAPSYMLVSRIENNGSRTWQKVLNSYADDWNYHYPALTTDGADGAICAWGDTRLGLQNSDVYAQRVQANGVLGNPSPGPYTPEHNDPRINIVGSSSFRLFLPSAGGITLDLFDIMGRKVRTIFNGYY
jgi:hypothetical protein